MPVCACHHARAPEKEEEEEEEDDATGTWFVHDGRQLADREGKGMTAATTVDCN